ncbi:hypothetical protein PHLGIDRAFT_127180 [Phlebiopsis gigantea 11061_1 CR5-6]|uniref:Vacuolar import and degradation protein n=1 Tax=Phlebiopsis gigantea (strain 11061_1 CR5-6) TaxID=745531 RepID=A0A0C3NSD6_PHLG1|nr:hypothetical protein PHLGIDRAFT_127180 [Phlebiopsis gigantea 11061_1 CR5-6]
MPSSATMPSEHPTAHAQQPPEQSQQQIKLCSTCHHPLSGDSAATTPFLLHDGEDPSDTTIVCSPCRARIIALRIEAAPLPAFAARGEVLFAQVERELRRRHASLQSGSNEADIMQQLAEPISLSPPQTTSPAHDEDVQMDSPVAAPHPASGSLADLARRPHFVEGSSCGPSTSASGRRALAVVVNHGLAPNQSLASTHVVSSPVAISPWASTSRDRAQHAHHAPAHPDPFVDITRLRLRSQGNRCLYPGATFQGTQKSGRNSYDVSVTIVDVDFSSSHLCGYLRIRGLTDDWPELTTYFDAEIIGSRYGFLTRKWGATEQEDMVHWGRFPAFRHVRNELKKPHLTMKDADRGAVFMRWKERFLVPDHRVQDISGASFAGFYYVCVDFNPQPAASHGLHDNSFPSAADDEPSLYPPLPKPDLAPRMRREPSQRGAQAISRSPSSSHAVQSNVATMSGFYFHQHSEPYQQLSLVHVPEHTSSSFEFR